MKKRLVYLLTNLLIGTLVSSTASYRIEIIENIRPVLVVLPELNLFKK